MAREEGQLERRWVKTPNRSKTSGRRLDANGIFSIAMAMWFKIRGVGSHQLL